MQKLVELCVQNPAKVLGFEAGEFKVGQKIEAVLFDMTQTQTVENPQSLFDTEKLEGRVVMSLSQMQREDFR